MVCLSKDCRYRVWTSGDEDNDFYYCNLVGVEVGRGLEECLDDRFSKELLEDEELG